MATQRRRSSHRWSTPPSPPRRATAALAALALIVLACAPSADADRVAETQRRVEAIREVDVRVDVPTRFEGSDTALAGVIDELASEPAASELQAWALALERLGMLPAGIDIVETLAVALPGSILGLYDPETTEMIVIDEDGAVGDDDLLVLAHEHAHAIQDARFDLDALSAGLDDDAAAAIAAIVEGEATLVMAIWAVKRLGAEDIERMTTADLPTNILDFEDPPPILARGAEFPYVDGAAFVFDRWQDGGWGAVDALFEAPPASTEQILHPSRYPDDRPIPVELRDLAASLGPGWAEATSVVLGEMQIAVLLADGAAWDLGDEDEIFTYPRLPRAEAAEGWGGDRLVHLQGPDGGWLVVWQTAWDGPRDADRFSAALRSAFEDLPAAWRVAAADVSGAGLAHPVLVLVGSSADVLATASGRLPISSRSD